MTEGVIKLFKELIMFLGVLTFALITLVPWSIGIGVILHEFEKRM